MSTLPVDTRTRYWRSPKGESSGSFTPNGKLTIVNEDTFRSNPEQWDNEDQMLSGRLFVGFNVGNSPMWSVNDLVPIVEKVRVAQGAAPDSSFLLQKGIYTSQVDGKTVKEDGAQVIVLNLAGASFKAFRAQMVELAEVICRELKQETVIVEIQEGGISKVTIGVGP